MATPRARSSGGRAPSTVEKYVKDARRSEKKAERFDRDPAAQALFRQQLADAIGEHDYWRR